MTDDITWLETLNRLTWSTIAARPDRSAIGWSDNANRHD
jgi:hypothetical protein